MRILVLSASLLLPATLAHAGDWKPFANDRYGFSIDIPASFKALPPPDNDDGRAFSSPDGRSEISAYGHLFVDVKGLAEDERQQERYITEDGLHVTYRQVSAQTATFSGQKGHRITYQHAIVTCKGLAVAIVHVEYPASDKAQFDPIIAHLVQTLHGSNGCWVPG